tara:strand:+ start:1429 stop:2316 length:888 start_codon:yes stop_codon:yes gene_type:complete
MRLDADTFTNEEVQAFSKENFISLKINASDKVGNSLFKKYNCKGLPHLLFIENNGNEIDRIIGYHEPGEYLTKIKNITQRKNTLDDYLNQFKNGNVAIENLANIARKYEDRNNINKAEEFYKLLIEKYSNDTSQFLQRAYYFIAFSKFINGDSDALNTYIDDNPQSEFVIQALWNQIRHYNDKDDRNKLINVFNKAFILFPKDVSFLNSYAWRMSELNYNLDDALLKARLAVKLSDINTKAGIIDTEAEVLWKLEKFDEAIEAIDRAIKIDSQNQYYKDQKEKFLQSKNNKAQPV